MFLGLTIFTLNIRTLDLLTCPKFCASPFYYLLKCLKYDFMSGKQCSPDQTLRFATSDLGLQCLHRYVYPKTYDYYRTTILLHDLVMAPAL